VAKAPSLPREARIISCIRDHKGEMRTGGGFQVHFRADSKCFSCLGLPTSTIKTFHNGPPVQPLERPPLECMVFLSVFHAPHHNFDRIEKRIPSIHRWLDRETGNAPLLPCQYARKPGMAKCRHQHVTAAHLVRDPAKDRHRPALQSARRASHAPPTIFISACWRYKHKPQTTMTVVAGQQSSRDEVATKID